MAKRTLFRWLLGAALLATCLGQTCVPDLGIIDDVIDDVIDDIDGNGGNGDANGGNGDGNGGDGLPVDTLQLVTYVTNTNAASGIAVRPSDGALFAVNRDGLFGPIAQGDDLSQMTPIGATNLADEDIFNLAQDELVLAITDAGEFWIGSDCCSTLAVVPPGGGDAVPFLGLLQGSSPSNIHPETMVIVPDSFTGDEVFPGNLLVGEETTFSRLSAIDVAGDQTVVNVENPSETNRQAHHLGFGPDGTLYSCRGVAGLTLAGFQTIAEDGTPTALTDTLGLAADTFVVDGDGDIILRGRYTPAGGTELSGVLIYDPDTGDIANGVALDTDEVSEHDEMIIAADVIYLALPERNEIVLVEPIP